MTNEIVKTGPNYYEKYGDAATARNIVGKLLKFTKFGEYLAGIENQQVHVGTVLVAYMPSLAVGFVRWEDNKPAEAQMGYVGDGFVSPRRNDLGWNDSSEWETDDRGAPRDPWQFTNSLIFVDPSDTETGVYTFNTSSKGGIGAVGGLSKAYGRHTRNAPRDLPKVRLGVDSYRHSNKAYGEIRYPVFSIDGWFPIDDLPPIDGLPEFREGPKQIEKSLKEELAGDDIPF